MRNKIKVVLAEDHHAFRSGLENYLKGMEEIKVVASAINGRELIDKVKLHQPDVVVTDMFMPYLSGLKLVDALMKSGVERIVVSSLLDSDQALFGLLKSGEISIVNKLSQMVEVGNAVISAYNNQPYFCNHIIGKVKILLSSSLWNGNPMQFIFTAEERQIIELTCQEKTSAEIAATLFKSKKVIDRAKTRIFEKMGVKSSVGLVVYAIRNSMFPDFHPGYVL